MHRPIYMDYNATTPVDPRVVEAMLPCFTEHFGNPASRTHSYGWAAARLAERSREQIASLLGVHPDEVIFTSGATESNNLAIKGVAWALGERGRHLITAATEHKAVLDPCRRLEAAGFEVTVLAVDRHGRVDPERVAAALRRDTVLVSVMLANNETGTLQPLAAIAAVCRAAGVLLHTDATQAVGKIAVDIGALGVDLLSLSGHKIYGPRGVGALIVRRQRPSLRLVPLLDGGGHEAGARSGTLNTPGIVGLARALEIACADIAEEGQRLTELRERLRERIAAGLGGVHENGHPSERLPNTLNLSFEGVDGNALLVGLSEVAVSAGSACTSAEPKSSHVLAALGVPPALAAASLRFSLGRGSTGREVDAVAAAVCRVVAELRERSPFHPPASNPGR